MSTPKVRGIFAILIRNESLQIKSISSTSRFKHIATAFLLREEFGSCEFPLNLAANGRDSDRAGEIRVGEGMDGPRSQVQLARMVFVFAMLASASLGYLSRLYSLYK